MHPLLFQDWVIHVGVWRYRFGIGRVACIYVILEKYPSISFAYLPKSGGTKGAAGAIFSDLVGLGRDKICFNLETYIAIMEDIFADTGWAHNTFFLGVGCSNVDCWWTGHRTAPTPSFTPCGLTSIFVYFFCHCSCSGMDLHLLCCPLLEPLVTTPSSRKLTLSTDGIIPRGSFF